MQIEFHNDFTKKYKKLPVKFQDKFDERLKIFSQDSFDPLLNNHGLHGKYRGCRSINVTGDLRAVYEVKEKGVRFLDIDNHSNLY